MPNTINVRLDDPNGYVVPGTSIYTLCPVEADAHAAALAETAPLGHTVRRIPITDPAPGGTFADWLAATTVPRAA